MRGRFIDEIGHVYGKWTVIQRAPKKNDNSARWLCQCVCGAERTFSGACLRAGETSNNCGCLDRNRTSKRCVVCGKEKELEQFSPHRGCIDGHRNKCNQCEEKRIRQRNLNGLETRLSAEYKSPRTKICSVCKQEKQMGEFSKHSYSSDGYKGECKQCRSQSYYQRSSQQRNAALQRIYGITQEQFNQMLIRQGGVCAICQERETALNAKSGKIKPLSVDHNHITGEVRGLLCQNCNAIIGYSNENKESLRTAVGYLEKWNSIDA